MNEIVAIRQSCPGCSHPEMDVFFESESAPVFCNVLWDSRAQAIAACRAPIHLAYCHKCGLIYNIAFNPQLTEYSEAYENSLHFSPRFREYAEDIASQLIQRYQLHDKNVIEIGCGQGDFLKILQRLGNNRVVGFDPSYSPQKIATASKSSEVMVIPEVYSEAHAGYPVDFICCRHVLEHIDRPLSFLTSIRKTIGRRKGCIVYFEVPNALYTFRKMGVWDIIYEHCSYFTSESLAKLFIRTGFEPIRVVEQYNGQFLTIEARAGTTNVNPLSGSERVLPNTIRKFHNAYREKVNAWQRTLSRLKKKEKHIVLWGAGSKGITFLNALDISHQQIEYIVDLNPRKHGRFVPCTGQQIIAPEFIKEYHPETVIIMNPIYRAEIQQLIWEMLGKGRNRIGGRLKFRSAV